MGERERVRRRRTLVSLRVPGILDGAAASGFDSCFAGLDSLGASGVLFGERAGGGVDCSFGMAASATLGGSA